MPATGAERHWGASRLVAGRRPGPPGECLSDARPRNRPRHRLDRLRPCPRRGLAAARDSAGDDPHPARLRAIDQGMIVARRGVARERRLAEIHGRVCELLDRHRPDALAIEELYFGANVQTAFAVGQARGVVLLAAGQRGIPTRSYTPQQVKSAVCGSGRAPKEQVGRMVARLLGLGGGPTPPHAAAAAAVAICELNAAPLARSLAAAGGRAGAAGEGGARTGDGGPPGV